jgi:FkbM family methyltransferase
MSYQGYDQQIFGHISYSQHGDDMAVANIFHLIGIKKPSYLDLGANHPFDISNTALFYARGSRGVNVEANPALLEAFKKHRPEDVNVNVGVGPEPGVLPLYMNGPTSGLNSFNLLALKEMNIPFQGTIDVNVITINDVVDQYCPGGKFPNFLNCDIEGYDYMVLESADFTHSAPMVICVEVRRKYSRAFQNLMHQKGYTMLLRCSENLIFVQNQYVDSLF